MAQTAMARESSRTANIEFTVYTFQRADGKNQERWLKQDSFGDMDQAMKKAETLFASGDFCKVEIKQKYTDPKNNRVVDTTLKVLQRKEKRTLGAGALAVMAVFGGILAFAVTYMLASN